MATTTDLEKLVINYLTQDQYDDAREAGTLNANELYLTPDTGSTGGTVTSVATGGGLTGGTITTSGTISHADTSSQSSVSNSGRTYIQSVTLDTYGHVTGLSSATETVTNSDENVKVSNTSTAKSYYLTFLDSSSVPVTKDLNVHVQGLVYTIGSSDSTLHIGVNKTSPLIGQISLASTSSASTLITPGTITSARTITLPDKTGTVALTSDIPDTSSFITVDEKLKWTASTTSNTYYPLQSTSTAATSTANTLNGISFYQYYNTAGGYRRLILGNTTAYTSTGGAYGTIRLYGTSATYYGDLNPGTIGNNSLTANRTWTLPDKTGTIALTSDIPDVSGFITTDSDKALQIEAVTSGTTYYPIVGSGTTAATRQYDGTGFAYTGTNGTANGSNGNALLTLGNSTASTTANWKKGTVRLYGTTAYYTDLVSGAPSANRTITFPNATGTVALTSDLSSFVTSSGVTSIATTSPISGGTITSTGTISHATSGVGTATTTAGFYKFKYDTYGHVTGVSSVTASDITNLVTIPTNTDENVKSTAVTAATTNYIVGSTTSTTTTGGLSKHASAVMYTTADSGTSGYTQLRLGNTTATTSAGGKEGQIRLYGTNATYYLDLKPGAIASSNKTITFPNATGTVALTSDIPDVSGFITSDSDYRVESIPLTTATTYYLLGSGSSGDVTSSVNKHASINAYVTADSSTSGYAYISIGNNTASGTTGAKEGYLRLYGTTAYYHEIKAYSNYPTANRTIYLPRYAGTMYLTCVGTTSAVGGATTAPVYVKSSGEIAAVTAIPYSLLTGIPTIPTITLNGTTTTSPSFYAPTSAGTSGYYLQSKGSGVPEWRQLYFINTEENQISTISDGEILLNNATTSSSGLMSAADKTLLDFIPQYTTWAEQVSFATTTANTWQNVGITITVPSGYMALVVLSTTYNSGRPYGLGLNTSSTISSTFAAPTLNIQSPSSSESLSRATFLLSSNTYYVFNKRAATGTNSYSALGFLFKTE